jgi:hypothetical protein
LVDNIELFVESLLLFSSNWLPEREIATSMLLLLLLYTVFLWVYGAYSAEQFELVLVRAILHGKFFGFTLLEVRKQCTETFSGKLVHDHLLEGAATL